MEQVRKKALIVEDDPFFQALLKESLKAFSYDIVGIAENEEQALEMVKVEKPDIALHDIHLKGNSDGLLAAEKIRTLANIPIVIISNMSDEVTIKRMLEAGPYAFLQKPYSEVELFAAMELAIQKNSTDIAMAAAVCNALEGEKKAISLELHENLSQKMAAILMNMQTIKKKIPEEYEFLVEQSMSLFNEAMEDMKSLSKMIMPLSLLDLGLQATLDDLKKTLLSSGKLVEFHISFSDEITLTKEQEIGIYRMIQGFITLIIRESLTKKIQLELTKNNNEVQIILQETESTSSYLPADAVTPNFKNLLYQAVALGARLEVVSIVPFHVDILL